MKKLLPLITVFSALNLLTGCNLNGDALLGERPANQNEVIISSYSVCQEKSLKETSSYGPSGCALPNRLEDILNGITTDGNSITFTFDAVAGTQYPKIRTLELEGYSYYSQPPRVKTADCKEISQPNDRFKKFTCTVSDNGTSHTKFYPRKLELVNENCGGVAVFESKFPHPKCDGYQSSSLNGFYINDQTVEGIYATKSN